MRVCNHEFVKVMEIPVGLDDGQFLPCVRWQCVHCGAYEDELEEDL